MRRPQNYFHPSSQSGLVSTPPLLDFLGGSEQKGDKISIGIIMNILIIMTILTTIIIMTIMTIIITTTRKALATIALISIAAGEVIGGATFGFFGRLTSRWGWEAS